MIDRANTRLTLVCLAFVLLAIELLLVSQNFDAYTLLQNGGLSTWQRSFAYFGMAAKFIVLAIFVFVVIRKDRLVADWYRLLAEFSIKRFCWLLPVQLLIYLVFVYFTWLIFSEPHIAHQLPAGFFIGWLGFAMATVVIWLFGLVQPAQLRHYLSREKYTLLLTVVTSLVTWFLALYSQSDWSILADKTFAVASWLLSGYGENLLHVDISTKELGLGDFVVSIAPACSGYEGIGLITAFTALHLFLHRKELRFPLALLLFPLGAITIWFLNCVRIAALVAIGYHWSPQVAVGGFHSQAGWITFILTSLALLWFASNSQLLSKSKTAPKPLGTNNLPVATLVPLVALLTTTLMTSALASNFDYLYPLRVLVVAIALYKVWSQLEIRPFKPRWDAAIAAVIVAVLWMVMLGTNSEKNAIFQAGLDGMPGRWAWLWLMFRFFGAVITVPIAEELAFRAYLFCKLSNTEVRTCGHLPVTIVAVVLSSLAFGALHGAWLAGTMAGLVYAWVRLRSTHIGDAILAHAGTNFILFVCAAIGGQWWWL